MFRLSKTLSRLLPFKTLQKFWLRISSCIAKAPDYQKLHRNLGKKSFTDILEIIIDPFKGKGVKKQGSLFFNFDLWTGTTVRLNRYGTVSRWHRQKEPLSPVESSVWVHRWSSWHLDEGAAGGVQGNRQVGHTSAGGHLATRDLTSEPTSVVRCSQCTRCLCMQNGSTDCEGTYLG